MHADLAVQYQEGSYDGEVVFPDPLRVGEYFEQYEDDPTDDWDCDDEEKDQGSWLYISETGGQKSTLLWDTARELDHFYRMRCPSKSVDGSLYNCWFDTSFSGYIRKSFEWGGFPGWERYSARPDKLIAYLKEGLLPV
jgi:hypothetical protein